MVLPLLVGRPRSVAALEEAVAGDGRLLLLAQLDPEVDDPGSSDLQRVGTVVRVLDHAPLPDGTWRVVFEGEARMAVERFHPAPVGGPLRARATPFPYPDAGTPGSPVAQAVARRVERAAREYVHLHPDLPNDLAGALGSPEKRVRMLHLVSGHLALSPPEKQRLLEEETVESALELLGTLLERENEILRIEERLDREMQGRRRDGVSEGSLPGDAAGLPPGFPGFGPAPDEWADVEARLAKAELPPHARERAEREFARLGRLSPASPEAGVIRGYLDWIFDLPWTARSEERADVARAREVLEAAHHGLDEVKDRILDHISVLALVGELQGPILCLVGPPGVGKTSFARSLARALDRKFVRVALGGVRDEAEIRGHRRTYVGSLPGRILQGMRRAGVGNPVFLLDEVDKLTQDAHGDPASALLEVLDPEQNQAFQDHYLELDYDLSDVLFLATANTLAGIPDALRDRMEVIRIPGYLETEKRVIARRFLLPSQLKRHGLGGSVTLEDEATAWLIRTYTREAGVRELDRALSRVSRKLAREVAEGHRGAADDEVLTPPRLRALLGPPTLIRVPREEGRDRVGLATGLAWTQAGGEILDVEVAVLPGSGRIQLTGTLGDVMKESAVAALTWARSRAAPLGLRPLFHQEVDVHVHIPEGATPKDGPSAGVTMAVALVSALTGRPTRSDVAMTGELTLRGRVLPVGGVREKTVAALRQGLTTVLLPAGNEGDLDLLPDEVRSELRLVLVSSMDEVLAAALLDAPGWNPPFAGGSH
ncbi:MAG: endopeptidase La [Gemmatimonadales bacterium]|nr:MAG: endopeptidase La [Gemmatimonadales bacterium]